nr:hypothetical protein [Campylobacter sp.]
MKEAIYEYEYLNHKGCMAFPEPIAKKDEKYLKTCIVAKHSPNATAATLCGIGLTHNELIAEVYLSKIDLNKDM